MAYTAQQVAHYIISKCMRDKRPITNLNLHKILYFVQVASIQAGRGAAFDDDMEAWQYGPIVRNVYYEFGRYGGMPITDTFNNFQIADEDRVFFDPIIEKRSAQKSWDLVKESHRDGCAWQMVYGGPRTHNIIPKEYFYKYG